MLYLTDRIQNNSDREKSMADPQRGILDDIPTQARYLHFRISAAAKPAELLAAIEDCYLPGSTVIGLGDSLIGYCGSQIDGLTTFPSYSHGGVDVPATPTALWIWLRGEDRGDLLHLSRSIMHRLHGLMEVADCVDAFRHREGRDLTGYEDGTENPSGGEASAAALVESGDSELAGSSFVAVQQWLHDLDYFKSLPQSEQDHIIGRRLDDNEELDDAPESAHVKRTAQESFEPEAFLLRRSMPWADLDSSGLMFVAFGHSVAAFEAQLERMTGAKDGTTDALFRFSRPLTGSYFWCPPVNGEDLDLSAIRTA